MIIVQPPDWPRPRGYSNGTVATGRHVFVAGQIGWDPVTEQIETDDFLGQFRQAIANVLAVLQAAGATPQQVTRMVWYITEREAYMSVRKQLGEAYREVMGQHYPAMTVIIVSGLIEPRAKIEIEATAVVPAES